jgi:hypothetical protein
MRGSSIGAVVALTLALSACGASPGLRLLAVDDKVVVEVSEASDEASPIVEEASTVGDVSAGGEGEPKPEPIDPVAVDEPLPVDEPTGSGEGYDRDGDGVFEVYDRDGDGVFEAYDRDGDGVIDPLPEWRELVTTTDGSEAYATATGVGGPPPHPRCTPRPTPWPKASCKPPQAARTWQRASQAR